MKKIGILSLAVILAVMVLVFIKKDPPKTYIEDATNERNVLSIDTGEATYDDMLAKIEPVQADSPFEVIRKNQKIYDEQFDSIMYKIIEFEWDDITVEIGAYFDVDEESGLIQDTLFAWVLPSEGDTAFNQMNITDLTLEYPNDSASIRARATYNGETCDLNLFYTIETLDDADGEAP